MDKLTPTDRHEFARELVIVARRWRARLDDRLKVLGMSQARWSALYWLSQSPEGASQTALADRTGVEAATLVRVIDALEAQGLVERKACPGDRRVKVVHLKEAARPLLAQIDALGEELRQEVMEDVTREEVDQALALLRRIRARLDGETTFAFPELLVANG
ncbi:MarR family transcriptional regulator [Phenylobacterium sp.]|uniref:MarR family transcriptional regulator n=1 Tax=Phenylobacterium sp. TaxID=1871053 RepID=UPI002C74B472|nr:MarR family transcriptional regulator [Phenylobacterium sp.]HVI32033.1 MarR family transcriptional regulator [Phenylobacterium sp.]